MLLSPLLQNKINWYILVACFWFLLVNLNYFVLVATCGKVLCDQTISCSSCSLQHFNVTEESGVKTETQTFNGRKYAHCFKLVGSKDDKNINVKCKRCTKGVLRTFPPPKIQPPTSWNTDKDSTTLWHSWKLTTVVCCILHNIDTRAIPQRNCA